MKTELAKVKVSPPDMSHKDRFKLAASNYKSKKSND
jgi:hypothetical protein